MFFHVMRHPPPVPACATHIHPGLKEFDGNYDFVKAFFLTMTMVERKKCDNPAD